jgi:hypothetical protein
MDQPKTRKETKKTDKEKRQGKESIYSSRHVRQMEELRDRKSK